MIKNMYSMSGLLPAQFRADPASNGIGWTTINTKIIEPEQVELKEPNEVSGDDYASALTEIKVGDFVQVHRDYPYSGFFPGGIYLVREVGKIGFKIRHTETNAWISGLYIRKVSLQEGTPVRTVGSVTPPGVVSSIKLDGLGYIYNIDQDTKETNSMIYAASINGGYHYWFNEGQLTLDD